MNQIPNIEETNTREVEENPEKKYLDGIMNQMVDNLIKANHPVFVTENVKTMEEIVKIECEKMYPEFLQRDCNDLVVILAGRLQTALHHQLQKARQDWLQEEVVKLEGMKQELLNKPYSLAESFVQETRKATNQVLQTIIDRYHSELDQDTDCPNCDVHGYCSVHLPDNK